MSKEYFTENIKDEILIEMIDKALNYEKRQKTGSIKANLLKIIPAVAAIALVIGTANMLPYITQNDVGSDTSNEINTNLYASAEYFAEVTTETTEATEATEITEASSDLDTYLFEREDSPEKKYGKNLDEWQEKRDEWYATSGRSYILFGPKFTGIEGVRCELKDGTIIISPILNVSNDNYRVKFAGSSLIEYANGVTVEAPVNTEVKFKKDTTYTITIGDGDATIAYPDGISETISAGTVLDGEGNIIK